jgi:UDP-glucose 4-epimerase
MIYGPNSKGNFKELIKLTEKLPFFPIVYNQRSMLFVENLSLFVKNIIDQQKKGIFFPQNDEYVQTSKLIEQIAKYTNNEITFINHLSIFVKILGYFPGKVGKLTNKAFGNLVYDISDDKLTFIDLEESVKRSVRNVNNG